MLLKIKHKIRMFFQKKLQNTKLWKLFCYCNMVLYHYKDREIQVKRKTGKNADKIFYVIRSFSVSEGLLSEYARVLDLIYKAVNSGYIPIVDFKNYKTQYSMEKPVNGTDNVWEYYFNQPTQYTLEEVYESRNIILGGVIPRYLKKISFQDDNERYEYIKKYADVKEYIYHLAEEKISEIEEDRLLGVFLRGTDYVKFQPKGCPKQPEIEDVIKKTKEFLENYKIKKIFLATEDYQIYKRFVSQFGDMVVSSDSSYIMDYDEKDYIYSYFTEDRYEVGLKYLTKMLCIAKCKYLVSSRAGGANFAVIMNHKQYEEAFIFDLGVY